MDRDQILAQNDHDLEGHQPWGHWKLDICPIIQVETARTTYIVEQYRVNTTTRFGRLPSQAERSGFPLMWRWVSPIDGANNQLLTPTTKELWSRWSFTSTYGPRKKVAGLARAMTDSTGGIVVYDRSLRFSNATVHELLTPAMVAPAKTDWMRGSYGTGTTHTLSDASCRQWQSSLELASRPSTCQEYSKLVERYSFGGNEGPRVPKARVPREESHRSTAHTGPGAS